ncbi:hypothetical protein BofuT4_P017630.1 [Botrytis cinerea T4]|uniref:Uncharacterized protein n=1 Tax=Botryotinia fuckeliana (strain T4) TaxID=999810 RepID=G2YIC0_BOTF4|nr:hypothetical protein BofuT4_P017630.1 [Botrytis cinerea T4]
MSLCNIDQSEVGLSSTLRQRETLSHEKCSFQRHKVTVFGIVHEIYIYPKGMAVSLPPGNSRERQHFTLPPQHKMTLRHNVKVTIEQRVEAKVNGGGSSVTERSLIGHEIRQGWPMV